MRLPHRLISFTIALLLSVLPLTSCRLLENVSDNLVGPTRTTSDDPLAYWYPCVVVHTPGHRGSLEFENQFNAIRQLVAAKRVEWLRLGSSDNPDYYNEARTLPVKILSIISTEQLDSYPTWEQAFDSIHPRFPSHIWEITGEISNPEINKRLMTPEEYMEKFWKLYNYTQKKYPQIKLASAPTFGSASTPNNPQGPKEFERFLELGLLEMDVVISINIYTPDALRQYAAIRNSQKYASKFARKEVWVTETSSLQHINHVKFFYADIVHSVRPAMTCWYALGSGSDGYAMINNIHLPNPDIGDLFKLLTSSGGGLQ